MDSIYRNKEEVFDFIFPEVQIFKCIKEYGFMRRKKIIKEGRIYISGKEKVSKNTSNSNFRKYMSYSMIYIHLFFFSLISLLVILAPIYFIFDVSRFFINGTINNTCLTMLYVFGVFGGASMLIPVVRKSYDIVPWMYFFVKVIFLDLMIMGVTLKSIFIINNQEISLLIMLLIFIILRIIMCIYVSRVDYTYDRNFKTFGSISFIVGFLGIIFL